MRSPSAAFVLAAILSSLAVPSTVSEPGPPGQHPLAATPIEIDPWFPGDRWTYETTTLFAAPDGTRITTQLNVTTTVSEVSTESVGGVTYSVYNSSTAGSASASGVLMISGANPFSVSGPLQGWSWSDRSNLASVAVNQTTNQTGTIQVGIFTFPVTIDAATTIRNLPALEEFDFPLELGDAWSFDGVANSTGAAVITAGPLGSMTQDLSGETNASYRAWFNATEDANVPAGVFLGAARLHGVAPSGNATDRWYHPAAKNVVKTEVHRQSAPNDYFHLWMNLTAISLVQSPPWLGSINLSPSRVVPGGSVLASGVASPNEDLFVLVPATGAAYPTRADGLGAWSLTFFAPTVDDFTPANADVGSHGVLVEPAVFPQGWDVATVQLVLPDLFAAAGDLTASDSSPLIGAAVTLNGTFHAGPVNVSSPFNVSFSVDGLEISRAAIPQLAASGSASAGAAWTATTPGTHTLTFTADSDDEVREANESNNTATISISVRGPDLSPWNITIEAESNATYADPSAANFTSAPIPGRIGGTVNVTFEAASVGVDTVADVFEVEVVETQGSRGPPIAGWRFSANVTTPLAPNARAGPWTARWPVPSSPGFYHLNVTVDAGDRAPESTEANNTFVVVILVSGPDYVMGNVSGPAKVTAGAAVTFQVEVRNDGNIDGSVDVPLAAFEGGSPTAFYTTAVASLAVGSSVFVTVPWTSPSPALPATLRFVIDPSDILEEMVETNNEASLAVDVRNPPVTAITVSGTNATTDRLWVRSSALFVLAAQDFSGDGLSTFYRVDAGATHTYTSAFGLSGEGAHSIDYWSEDNLGGVEAGRTLSATVDDLPPTTNATVGAQTDDRTTVSLTSTDGSGVGVSRIEYRIDNGAWESYAGPFDVSGLGRHLVEFRATDALGNEEPTASREVEIGIHSRPPLVGPNFKPPLAGAFAAVLVILALIPKPPRGYVGSLSFSIGLAFAASEAATGIASLMWDAFAIRSDLSTSLGGIAVDVGIFLAGILSILFVRRRFEGASF